MVAKSLDLYLVFELCPSGDLYNIHQLLTPEACKRLMKQLLEALR